MNELDELLEEIQSLTEGAYWRISLDHVLLLIQLNKEDYYKRLYSTRYDSASSTIPANDFDTDNINELIGFLEACGYHNAV